MELKERERVAKDLQEIVDNYSGSWKRFNVLDGALALIKELTEENERLNERLDREAKCQYDLATKIVDLRDDVKYIKADTVQKMQEKIRAKSEYGTINISPWQLDQIVKEMLEENNV